VRVVFHRYWDEHGRKPEGKLDEGKSNDRHERGKG